MVVVLMSIHRFTQDPALSGAHLQTYSHLEYLLRCLTTYYAAFVNPWPSCFAPLLHRARLL